MRKTSPTDRVRSGYVPVEIRYMHASELRKMTLWCEHQEEALALMGVFMKPKFPGFRGKYFTLAPGLKMVSIERTDWLTG
jgi:hypothetical protein